MIIHRLFVPEVEAAFDGLREINLTRLGHYVALTGKNGSGKTRILNRLHACINARESLLPSLPNFLNNISNLKSTLATNPGHPNRKDWEAALETNQRNLITCNDRIFVSPPERRVVAVPFVPKQLGLQDPRSQARGTIVGYYEQAKSPGIAGFEQRCFPYIQTLQDRHWEATHPKTTIAQPRQQEIQVDYEALQKIISALLKSPLTRSEDGNASLFGKPLADAGLSDGQKVLIQLAVAIHAQTGRLDDTVLLLDEPENHLHPSALIEFLSALSTSAPNSQIWLATHSIPLLSYVAAREPMSIWYTEVGKASNAGRHPEIVLRGLLGDEEQIAVLHSFTSLPAQYAATNFAVESMLAPQVIGHQSRDDQITQIVNLVGIGAATRRPITLLDYGAGKGRLLSGFSEMLEGAERPLRETLNYLAFEPSPIDCEVCKQAIESVYGSDSGRYFSSREDFF